jgi:hypothetical protein
VSDLKALHEAAMRAESVGGQCPCERVQTMGYGCHKALGGAECYEYRPRPVESVGGERMSECIRPHLRDCPTCAYNGRCDAQDATSLERKPLDGERMSECGFILAQGESCPTCQKRKPLDGYDWRADLEFLDGAADTEDTQYEETIRLTAHIESLEADVDALEEAAEIAAGWLCNSRLVSDQSMDICLEAAIARAKGRAK